MRGFVKMDAATEAPPATASLPLRLKAAVADHPEAIVALRPAWRALTDKSDLPTAQFEWAASAISRDKRVSPAKVFYVTDPNSVRAILPLVSIVRNGVEQYQYTMPPGASLPVDIPHLEPQSLRKLLGYIKRSGRPVHLPGLIEQSPAADYLKALADTRFSRISIEQADPAHYLPIQGFTLQERSQASTRVSIMAAGYGISGGPNDVIFQYASPSLEQVMTLYHEVQHIQGNYTQPNYNRPDGELDTMEFLRSHTFNCAQRGEIRFSCLRLAGTLLAAQMLQIRQKTAWLLSAGVDERFKSTNIAGLLTSETIRKLLSEKVERMVVPSVQAMREVGVCYPIPRLNVTIYPFSSRSLLAAVMNRLRPDRREN